MKYYLLVVLSFILLGLSCSKDSPVNPTLSKTDLVYISWTPEGKLGLFGINKDGSDKQLLFLLPPSTSFVKYSPDKKQLLAIGGKANNNGSFKTTVYSTIYSINSLGSAKVLVSVPDNKQIWDAGWSVDGRHLVYSIHDLYPAQEGEIYIINSDGSGNKFLTKEERASSPLLSHSGKVIYAAKNKILSLNQENGKKNILVTLDSNAIIGNLSFSPDGKKISFNSHIQKYQEHPGQGLFVMNSDGTEMKRLFSTFQIDYTVTDWSNDSERILITEIEDPPYRISSINTDGTGLEFFKQDHNLLYAYGASWSEDEKHIAYNGIFNSDIITSVYIMNSGGNSLKRLVADAYNPIWLR